MIALDLKDKVIMVTGGFGSLGASVGRTLVTAGAQVALVDRADASRAPKDVDGAFALGDVDLASTSAADDAVARVAARFGRIDALVNVAGGFRWETVADGSVDTWDLLYRTNVQTAVNASQAVLPHLLAASSGSIVNIGALASTKAAMGMGAYAASKAGVAKLTEAMAEEFKGRGITVNAVLPSIIDTAANRSDMPDADFSRWVKAEQIAELIVFLVSDRARAITGALIPISGGM